MTDAPICNNVKCCIIVTDKDLQEINPYNGQVHLTDKSHTTATPADGTVEVYLHNGWYQVCNNTAFTNTVADSICRQYGYTGHDTRNEINIYSSNTVTFTEYNCTNKTGSFECFTHCMPRKYKINDKCHHHVTLTCKFDMTKEYITSGSRSQCALDERSHCALDERSHLLQAYKIITGLLAGFLLFILALFIITFLFCDIKTKKMKCCCYWRKQDALNYVHIKYRVNDLPRNN
ncbi:PREDICTED: uncharacterized protein LOC109586624 [Amphimedon queenslandica]|uniref:SRCR domain-containing protein n=1 Tax=Amphimedon queenslandica TaxID=400682 RepID=A0AAN0JNM8_AMPQE|nr:PREDICTED: uncharacterized protein LOC109586624 [Amphimedon queenslandica]|eukprot:XP_019858377.1 PREDICTED: uncharacterized protein LOC109586624 [Amphimedon queenslandica]